MGYLFIIGNNFIMKNKFFLILFLFFSCSISDFKSKKDTEKIVDFSYDYYFLDNDSIQYDFEYSIPYNELVFTKDITHFYSNITTEIKILNSHNEMIMNDSWSDDIILHSFDITKSDAYHTLKYSAKMKKYDTYTLYLTINDYSNHIKNFFSTELIYNDYIYLSKINLYKKENGLLKKINYNKNNKINFIDTIWTKFQIIDDVNNKDRISIEIDNYDNYQLLEFENITPYEIYFLPILLDTSYTKKIDFKYKYKSISKNISLYITDDNYIDYNYENLIVPITYILNKDQYLEYIDLDSIAKINYISKFWKKMESKDFFNEFYSRIEYANKRFFSSLKQGCETDMGKIFIIYGPPDTVENRIDEFGRYEIWTYHNNKKFIFINRFGFYECYRC